MIITSRFDSILNNRYNKIDLNSPRIIMALTPPTKIKYLTNKDLLEEIHRSKITYCSYVDPSHTRYDFIVGDIKLVTLAKIEEARKKRLNEMQVAERKLQITEGIKDPRVSSSINDIPIESVVIRVMTYEHIPINPEKIDNAKTIAERHIRCNFPPFQHYIMQDGELKCVLKSHWKGGIENGHFSKEHGKMTNSLAVMFMKLVDRYGHRGNWRGYCVDTATEALTKRGWLNIDNINEDDTILSYSNGSLKWSSIKSIYRGHYEGLMHHLTVRGMDALITPNHKLVTERGLIKAEHLIESDRVILMGSAVEDGSGSYDDKLVELVGWIVTEGCYESNENGIKRITIYQNHGPKANRIRDCLIKLGYKFSESAPTRKNIAFALSRENSREIAKLLPNKNLTMEFILSLTNPQRKLLINTMIDGDGWRVNGHRRYVQKSKDGIDMLQSLCTLAGIKTNHYLVEDHPSFDTTSTYYQMNLFSERGNATRAECIDFHGGKRNGRNGRGPGSGRGKEHHPNEPTTYYNGMVWCPETEYGCFVARRNGKAYLTGNTYIDEMKSQALLQLSQVGLQFDESRSETPNPFAYYTQTITNSFMRILNIEKKNQTIRDDILIMHGASPSWTRQTEDAIKQQGATGT
jgi:hypothetical protein